MTFSCAEDTLAYLLRTVGEKGSSSLQWGALQEAFNLMAEHIDQANTQALWAVLQVGETPLPFSVAVNR